MHHRTKQINTIGLASCKALALVVAIAACLPAYVLAAEPATAQEAVVNFDIPAGDLSVALERFSAQSGIQAMYRQELIVAKRAQAVSGVLSPSVALARLLEGTGLVSERVNARTYVLKPVQPIPAKRESQTSKSEIKAEQNTQQSEAKDLEKMVVVGSRLGVSPIDSAMPIQVITREQIDRSGSANIAQVLSYLSEVSVNNGGDRPIGVGDGLQSGGNTNSTTVQLRGMPRGTTLVLINGRRAGDSATYSDTGQFDLSTIPLSLVERIEVLPAGSSAIYGGDGLAGVVNVVLRRDANGVEARYRQSHANGYKTAQASVIWGKTWQRGDLTVAANWSKDDSLHNSERGLTANQDYSRFGGDDWRTDASMPGTVYSLQGCPDPDDLCFLDLSERGNLPGLNSPFATVPSGTNGVGLTTQDFLRTQGVVNRASSSRHLRSAEENAGITLNGRVSINSSIDAFVELSHTMREVPAYEMPLLTSVAEWAFSYARVPSTNPFNPFGVDVAVGFNFENTGVFTSYDQKYYRGALGIQGKHGAVQWELSGWQTIDESETRGAMYFDSDLVTAAMSSTDPATALNPFVGNGGAPGSQELLNSLIVRLDGTARSRTRGLTGYIRAQPFQMPAGPLTALMGAEHQRQDYKIDTNNISTVVQQADGATSSTAWFAEARIPLISPREGSSVERMALTTALRRESSSRYESDATTEAIGLEFRPLDSLLLRSTYSTAFRPLLNYYAVLDPSYRMQSITDPVNGGSRYQVRVRQRGGAPEDLKPEESRNLTFGLLYRPASMWSLSLTHWSMKFTDQISFIGVQTLVNEELDRPGRITRNPQSGLIEEIDGRQANIALMSAAGVDLGLDANWTTAFGELRAGVSATYTYEHERQSTPTSPIENGVGRLNTYAWAPRWKIVPRLYWDRGTFRTMLTGRYVSKYEDSQPYQTGPNTGARHFLGDFWLVDLNMDMSVGHLIPKKGFISDVNLSIGVNNLFDQDPRVCFGCYESGYDASQYDILGRSIYAEVRLTF